MNNSISLILLSFLWVYPISAKPVRPNVLFLICDDLNTALSGFGHPQCKTPELDRLASRGMRFENMHCQYPVCGSSRASLMSGLYPYTNGTLGNSGTLRDNMPDVITMSQMFRNNGYRVGRVSKIYHMGIPPEILLGTATRDDPLSWGRPGEVLRDSGEALKLLDAWSAEGGLTRAYGVVLEDCWSPLGALWERH